MHTSIYACLSGLLLVWLAFNVIRERRANKVKLRDDGVFKLQSAIRSHCNFAEHMPITIILILLFEYNGAPIWMIHTIGVTFLAR
ncbi:MAG: MAPEG family protein [Bdellovibrio sp.]|nr:MAPEG family protein [Methylotenera sp.]